MPKCKYFLLTAVIISANTNKHASPSDTEDMKIRDKRVKRYKSELTHEVIFIYSFFFFLFYCFLQASTHFPGIVFNDKWNIEIGV